MPTQILVVPPLVVEALGGKTAKRVTGTLNGYPVRLGLLPLAGGGRYLMISKDLCHTAGIRLGQHVTLTLAPDPEPNRVDLPDELTEALAAWPEAEVGFNGYSASLQRAMAQHVATAKQAETRARRAVELAARLARGAHPFRKS
jgi:hypothetical protein